MADKIDFLPVKFDGKNYVLWEFHLHNFVEGKEKELWGFIDGSITKLDDSRSNDLEGIGFVKISCSTSLPEWVLSSQF